MNKDTHSFDVAKLVVDILRVLIRVTSRLAWLHALRLVLSRSLAIADNHENKNSVPTQLGSNTRPSIYSRQYRKTNGYYHCIYCHRPRPYSHLHVCSVALFLAYAFHCDVGFPPEKKKRETESCNHEVSVLGLWGGVV